MADTNDKTLAKTLWSETMIDMLISCSTMLTLQSVTCLFLELNLSQNTLINGDLKLGQSTSPALKFVPGEFFQRTRLCIHIRF